MGTGLVVFLYNLFEVFSQKARHNGPECFYVLHAMAFPNHYMLIRIWEGIGSQSIDDLFAHRHRRPQCIFPTRDQQNRSANLLYWNDGLRDPFFIEERMLISLPVPMSYQSHNKCGRKLQGNKR